MKKIPFSLVFLICVAQACSQQPDPTYFNEVPPGTTPKIFASGKVSTPEEFEFGAVFSNDRTEFYYGIFLNGRAETRMIKFEPGTNGGRWSKPVKILVDNVYSYNDPFLTPDNKKLFFISDRPLSGTGPKKDYDIWYVEREAGKWSQPKNAGPNINSEKNEYYISFTNSGKMYFSSNEDDTEEKNNYDIYTSEFKNGDFQHPVKLSPAINTASYEADVFVSPDESYVVFAADRPGD
jgi:hypothetical protein